MRHPACPLEPSMEPAAHPGAGDRGGGAHRSRCGPARRRGDVRQGRRPHRPGQLSDLPPARIGGPDVAAHLPRGAPLRLARTEPRRPSASCLRTISTPGSESRTSRTTWRLSDDEIETFVAWVDAGAPEGDPSDLPPPIEWPNEQKWQLEDILGPPDHVIKSKPFDVPRRGRRTPGGGRACPPGSTRTGGRWRSRRVPSFPAGRQVVHHAIPRLLRAHRRGRVPAHPEPVRIRHGQGRRARAPATPPGSSRRTT